MNTYMNDDPFDIGVVQFNGLPFIILNMMTIAPDPNKLNTSHAWLHLALTVCLLLWSR